HPRVAGTNFGHRSGLTMHRSSRTQLDFLKRNGVGVVFVAFVSLRVNPDSRAQDVAQSATCQFTAETRSPLDPVEPAGDRSVLEYFFRCSPKRSKCPPNTAKVGHRAQFGR